MSLLLELGVQANWQQVYDEFRTVGVINDSTYTPIPAFEIGFTFDSPILAVRTRSTTSPARWRFAGTLTQKIQLGTGGAASSLPVADATVRRLDLNRTRLAIFPQLTTEYQIVFAPPYWIEDLRLTIWQYTGPVADSIAADLERIETKIDALNET